MSRADAFGIIAPHPPVFVEAVGGGRARATQASIDALGDAKRALGAFGPDLLVIMSPHAPAAVDRFLIDDSQVLSGSLAQFGDDRLWEWPGDPAFAHGLLGALGDQDVPASPRSAEPQFQPGVLDHATIVPLSFLDPEQRLPIVVLSLSYLPYAAHRQLGEVLSRTVGNLGRRVAFIASGDLSHRLTPDAPAGYSERAKDLDEAIVGLVRQGKLSELGSLSPGLVEAGGECGLRSFITLGGFVGDDPVPTRVLSYEGPWGVGYLTALVGDAATAEDEKTIITTEKDHKSGTAGDAGARDSDTLEPSERESEIVMLARRAIETYVRDGRRPEVRTLPPDAYPTQAGAFVSLHRHGSLRGCIGTIFPTRASLAEEVAANAVQAAVSDPRFPPLSPEELDGLDVKVDVLYPPEACTIDDLDPTQYGLITTAGDRRGLLLPDLEGVDDVATQIAVTLSKAGIGPEEPCGYQRFKVERYT